MRPLSDTLKDRFAVILAILVVGMVTFVGVGTYLTVTSHNGDLHRIAVLTQEVRTAQLQHSQDVEETDRYAKQIEKYAQALEAEIAANHNTSYADQQAICAAIPGCQLPGP